MSAGEVLQVQERRLGPQDGMSCRETWAFLPWTCLSMFTPIILHTRVVCAAVVTFYSSEWRGGGELQYGEKKLIVKITSIPAMMFRVPVEQEASMASSKQIKTYSTMNPFCFRMLQAWARWRKWCEEPSLPQQTSWLSRSMSYNHV